MTKIIQDIYGLLPNELKKAHVFRSLANPDAILYNYGNPLSVGGNKIESFGDGENQELRILYLAVFLADQFLQSKKRDEWLEKIKDKSRHADYLFEMRPLLGIRQELKIEHETTDNCCGGRNVDWKIQNNNTVILLEMKNRVKPKIEHFDDLARLAEDLEKGIPPEKIAPCKPPSNTDSIFKSVESKFKERKRNYLQGVWINTGIKEDEIKLLKYFENNLDSEKIQFVIISGWKNEINNILTRESDQKK